VSQYSQIAIFDGDNTLWDTNAVFTGAQKGLLQGLKLAGVSGRPCQMAPGIVSTPT
jgi:hypothetical protein